MLTERGWVGLGDLRDDDYVATAPRLLRPLTPATASRGRLRLLGYLLGDGSLSTRSVVAFATPTRCCSMSSRRSLPTPSRPPGPVGSPGPTALPRSRSATGRATAGAHRRCWSGSGASASRPDRARSRAGPVPREVGARGGLPRRRRRRRPVSRRLWDCDGYVGERVAHYRTVSPQLAKEVQLLLLRLGMRSTVTTADYVVPGSGASRTAHQVSVFDGATFGAHVGVHLAARHKREALFIAESRGATLPRAEVVDRSGRTSPPPCRAYADVNGVPRWHFSPYASAKHPRVHVNTLAAVIDDLGLEEWQRAARGWTGCPSPRWSPPACSGFTTSPWTRSTTSWPTGSSPTTASTRSR